MTKSKTDVGMPMHMYLAPSGVECDDPLDVSDEGWRRHGGGAS